jgi:tripartite-type tricarboxylate transporter receptor subunit TctC
MSKIVHSAEMKSRLVNEGADPVASTPAQFAEYMKADSAKWARVIRTANIRPE